MRTYLYVDGFNLYYRAVRGTPYKWLDLKALASRVLKPHHQIQRIKYFTAPVHGTLDDPEKPLRQETYLRALRAFLPELEIYHGHFLSHPARARLADAPPDRPQYARIIKTEEKGSDVNLAVHLLNDAWLDVYDAAVIISNDSDLAEGIRLVREQHNKIVGVIVPTKPARYRNPKESVRISVQLRRRATFVRELRGPALSESQLPSPIPGTQITRPVAWL